MRGKWRIGRYERRFQTLSHLSMVILHTCVRITREMVDNDEFGAVTANLTIALSSRSVAVIGRPLTS